MDLISPVWKGVPRMQLSHAFPVKVMVFNEPTLVSQAALVPAMSLAARAGLLELADRQLTVSGGAGHAAGVEGVRACRGHGRRC